MTWLTCKDHQHNKHHYVDSINPLKSLDQLHKLKGIRDNANYITTEARARLLLHLILICLVHKHSEKDTIIGIAQLNFIANLTYQGGVRAQIEGVRAHKNCRSQGIGKQLFMHLIDMAKQRGCHMVQLTTDKSRPEAYQFYQQLGFINSHDGFKLHLLEIK